jgi:hypothetical protein
MTRKAHDTIIEVLKELSNWCETARYSLGAVDGYDHRSGEEFGIRRVELQIEKRIHNLRTSALSSHNSPTEAR